MAVDEDYVLLPTEIFALTLKKDNWGDYVPDQLYAVPLTYLPEIYPEMLGAENILKEGAMVQAVKGLVKDAEKFLVKKSALSFLKRAFVWLASIVLVGILLFNLFVLALSVCGLEPALIGVISAWNACMAAFVLFVVTS